MRKEETIERYGEEAYKKQLEQMHAWNVANPKKIQTYRKAWKAAHPERVRAAIKVWRVGNPEKVKEHNQEHCRKGRKFYQKQLLYMHTGLQGERSKIRVKHAKKWRPYKSIIAPDSQIHHQWIPGTSDYTGLALVEKDQHQHGFIDVIRILEGKITLYSEEEVRRGNEV